MLLSTFSYWVRFGQVLAIVIAMLLMGAMPGLADGFSTDKIPNIGNKLPPPQAVAFDMADTVEEVFGVELPSDRVFVVGENQNWTNSLKVVPGAPTDDRKENALGNQIVTNVEVSRYVGKVNVANRLTNAKKMIDKEILGAKAILLVAHWDYDVSHWNAAGVPPCGVQGGIPPWVDDAQKRIGPPTSGEPPDANDCEAGPREVRQVFYDGVGGLRIPANVVAVSGGKSNPGPADTWDERWVLVAYEIPIADLRFPEPGQSG